MKMWLCWKLVAKLLLTSAEPEHFVQLFSMHNSHGAGVGGDDSLGQLPSQYFSFSLMINKLTVRKRLFFSGMVHIWEIQF